MIRTLSSLLIHLAPPAKILLFAATLGAGVATSGEASPITPGHLAAASTTQSIGLEWQVSGDTNHNAMTSVEYRQTGQANWQSGMGLVRVDSSNGNTLAGSLMFLRPGTEYEVRLVLSDPDGGDDNRTIFVSTQALPSLPPPIRQLHVVPGNGGGSGTEMDPYQGLQAAWSTAQPGDEILLHAGSYGGITDDTGRSGSAEAPIVIRGAGDGDAVVSYMQVFQSSHLWIEGLVFRHDGTSDTGFYSSLLVAGYDNGFQPMQADIHHIVLKNNRFDGYKHAIRAGPRTSRWYISDNTIVGDKQLGITGTASFDGEGIELGHGDNHEVLYNSITRVADGVSFPNHNCDIYGNDIFDVTDDGIELDGGQANTRAWQNRIHNAAHNGIAFQPQSGAPWYLIRNQVVNSEESIFKFRDGDRFVAINNTFVNWGDVLDHWSHQVLRGVTRNNLWISVDDGSIWRRGTEGTSWRTNHDYDGFDWGSNFEPFEINGVQYRDLNELRTATGQQLNGIRIDARRCLAEFDVPGPPPLTTVPPQHITLMPECDAVDAGISIPNLSDNFQGDAPDLGAYELGQPLPAFGPRNGDSANRSPVANAGADQDGDEGTRITVSGVASTDPDGDVLTYTWGQVAGTSATITDPDQMTTDIILPDIPANEILTFRLAVTDPSGASDTDDMSVTVRDRTASNNPPTANAGPDQSGDEGTQLVLSGVMSFDVDGDAMQYFWSQTAGVSAALSNADQAEAMVILPLVSLDTNLEFQLQVSDPTGATATDNVRVTVRDVPGKGNPTGGRGSGLIKPLWLLLFSLCALLRLRRQ